MKIWYQSASGYGFEPVWDEYGKALVEQCSSVLHPDTELHVAGIPVMVRDVENWRSLQYYQNAQVLNNMKRAEAEGYDAFVIGCTLDVALPEGKSMLGIPVVGISETAYRMAMTMGRLYAVVTSSSAFTEVYGEQAERYGVAGRYLQRPYIVPASEEELAAALSNPGPVIEKFTAAARRAIADGASVIVPAPAFSPRWRTGRAFTPSTVHWCWTPFHLPSRRARCWRACARQGLHRPAGSASMPRLAPR